MAPTRRHSPLSIALVFAAICSCAFSAKPANPPPAIENVDFAKLRLHPFSSKWLFFPAFVQNNRQLSPLADISRSNPTSDQPQAFGRGVIYLLTNQENEAEDSSSAFGFVDSQADVGAHLILQLGKKNPGARDLAPAVVANDNTIALLSENFYAGQTAEVKDNLVSLSTAQSSKKFFFLALDKQSAIYLFSNDKIELVYRFPDDNHVQLLAFADLDGKGDADTLLLDCDNPPRFEILGITPTGNWWRLAEPVQKK